MTPSHPIHPSVFDDSLMTSEPLHIHTDDEISLLDLVAVIVEHLRLLLLGPVMAGMLAFGVASLLPVKWSSVVVLRGGSAATPGLVSSAAVLTPVAQSLGLAPGESVDAAVDRLRGKVKASFNSKDQMVTLVVTDATAAQAQKIASLVWGQVKLASAPVGPERQRLEQQLADMLRRSDQLESTIQPLIQRLKQGTTDIRTESVRSYAQLLETALRLDSERVALEKQLAGMDDSALLQPPSLPDRPEPRRRSVVTLAAALGTAVALFLFVLVRQGVRNAQQDPLSADKVRRIQAGWRRFWGARAA